MKVLIKSAKIIQPESSYHQKTVDVLVENGVIKEISTTINTSADRVIENENLHLSSGWFDSSVSFGEPGYEERETLENGLLTAAKSGFTSLVLNPDTHPKTDHRSAVKYLKNQSVNSATQLYPAGCLTQEGKGAELAELFDMKNTGAVVFGDYKKPVENPNMLKIALQYSQSFDALIQTFPIERQLSKNGVVHEGEHSTKLGLKGIPAFAEEIQIGRDLKILEYTGGKLHIPTISTKKSVELIAAAKKEGWDVTCSVALYNLFFTDEKLIEFDSVYKVLPPIRSAEDQKALLEGVKNGIIDMVTTDHKPLNIELKKLEFEQAEYGSIGLEAAFGVLNKLFGIEQAVKILTSGKDRFSVEKTKLKEGEKADFTLFNPSKEYHFSDAEIYSTSKNSMYLNEELKGKVYGVLANNQLIEND